MPDLSYFRSTEFKIRDSDYGNCIDVSAVSNDFVGIDGDFPMSQQFIEDMSSFERPFRHHIGRFKKEDIPKLIEALQKTLEED